MPSATDMYALPTVSVIIPVHNRTAPLRATLRSLHRQTLPTDRFEVIIVDDGSSEPLEPDVADLVTGGAPMTVVRNDTAIGAPAARNRGAEYATHDVLLFLDAECIAHPDLLLAHARAHHRRPAAYCGYTSARELTPEQWPVVIGTDWDFEDTEEVFRQIELNPLLQDPLVSLLAEPASTDWAFFWTSAASVQATAFRQIDGFETSFEVKGVEDMEIAYRLAQIGLPTLFLPDGICLHQPHDRPRHMELIRDRRNDHIMLALHPDLEVESVCGFGVLPARDLYPVLVSFADGLPTAAADCTGLSGTDEVVSLIRAANGSTLLLGHPAGWPSDLTPPTSVIFPVEMPDSPSSLRLLGARLPFANGIFALGVITDYWRNFPVRTLCRMLDELLRTCRDVVLMVNVSGTPSTGPSPELAQALSTWDRPFWEFTVRLRRELHEFTFTPIREKSDVRAYRIEARPWPMTDLAAALNGVASQQHRQCHHEGMVPTI